MKEEYCVYYHKNKINGKLYIGMSKNPSERWARNGENYSNCPLFYKAIKKYGWDNFDHVVLIDGLSKEIACECEKSLIQKYDTINSDNGYNLAYGGSGGVTMKGETHVLSKPVYQYDLSGTFIRKWDNAQRASEELGISVSDIHRTSREEGLYIKKAGDFMWRYEYYENIIPYVKDGYSKRAIVKMDDHFKIIERYKNISHIESSKSKARERITNCCKMKQISSGGFFWAYEDSIEETVEWIKKKLETHNINLHKKRSTLKRCTALCKTVLQYDTDNNLIAEYLSSKEASEATGIPRGTIQAYCKRGSGKGDKHGFVWKYAS